ncbi:MAG: hypothetical protein NT105_16700 [Verrucomicrobia bacterium]|nr:hypothetical protein [Verrucomicrobiota bacterium]
MEQIIHVGVIGCGHSRPNDVRSVCALAGPMVVGCARANAMRAVCGSCYNKQNNPVKRITPRTE